MKAFQNLTKIQLETKILHFTNFMMLLTLACFLLILVIFSVYFFMTSFSGLLEKTTDAILLAAKRGNIIWVLFFVYLCNIVLSVAIFAFE